ncbi:serine hydrolase domain-containing protein [Saxibacter everestensis]|uniref:Serine hydrolase domain-containing protein n=1 Tax=Saxibacter everestensis TaxID=2909229 RepID=A0ABY8QWP4_9MICO|nr:serine hydrolase domain-containing protein [Brevibacteriaceae bacterium ZFBP1038]
MAQFLLLTLPSRAMAAPAKDVHAWLEEVSAGGVPATAVVVTRGDEVEVETGAGSIGGRPVDEHTPFRIESLSKSFTATAVMQLVEEKHIDLDTPVVEYLPDLRIDDSRAETITVREVLNQSSGLTDASLGFNQYSAGPSSPREAVALLSRSHLDFDPGTDWAYSNPNYWICAWLIEEVSDMDLETYLERKILDPLGMTETTSAPTRDQVGGADGHTYAYGVPVQVTAPDAVVAGSGGMTSTAHDMGIWLRFQQGALSDGEGVLSTGMREEMHHRQAPVGGLYALGWYSGPPADGGVERVSHSGVGAGTGAYQGLFPDGVGVAVLQASSAPDPYKVAAALYDYSEGGTLGAAPSVPGPGRDLIITLIVLVVLAMCARGVVRSRRWASRAKRVRASLTLGAGALVATAGFTIPVWGSLLLGRAAAWPVLFAGAPVPVIAILATSLSIGVLTIVRLARLGQSVQR